MTTSAYAYSYTHTYGDENTCTHFCFSLGKSTVFEMKLWISSSGLYYTACF